MCPPRSDNTLIMPLGTSVLLSLSDDEADDQTAQS